jgi:alpha-beta hydrolase superfamily lysophospholipase
LSACAPHIEAAGPPVSAPALTADHVLTTDRMRLPLRVWQAEGETKAVVVAVHGFNDYSYAFDVPARYWAKQGLTTYAYDQRSFGEAGRRGLWPGVDTLVRDLGEITGLVGDTHPGKPIYLVGESMGGAAVIMLLSRTDAPQVDGAVLVAPAVWGWHTMNPIYGSVLWLSAHVIPWAKVTGRGLGIKPSDNRAMLIALSRDPLTIKHTRIDAIYGLVNLMDEAFLAAARVRVPTLALYGENDELVPKEPTFEMLRRLSGPRRVAIYPTGYHMLLRDLQSEAVLDDIVTWIENPAAPLPSGNETDAQQFFANK